MTKLRVYLPIDDLQPQFAAYLSGSSRARGYPVYAGEHSLLIEVSPALAIHRVCDLALKSVPELEPGVLYTERQFGLLELHSADKFVVDTAGRAILNGIGARAEDQMVLEVLFHDIIESIADQHAIILNRARGASMLVPGAALLLFEMTPALFACAAANAAERAVPSVTLIDLQMIGASGRVFLAGDSNELATARDAIYAVLNAVNARHDSSQSNE